MGEPFTLDTFDGTATTRVNNIVNGNFLNGATGYIADFRFDAAYKYYEFGSSEIAISQGNQDQ